eukprot:CAMPEP_0182924346 /NCGR_PEP_ID=MMETSP0105_2-20130417/5987_1 /TAXON_ID=81532 ORGANISM="Acanthoeca-like sp., Strain 10tr" /NCGR_SAMPLE_ID=MMETSP0105_2 /ASSEMBLY_ACC=CAM_ASM_000205 /LENGTH=618 /DNA_ID=CAMNT_0025062115 /DNA_START=251 /DNA_END=2108 /DNA_ORIENTATION=-
MDSAPPRAAWGKLNTVLDAHPICAVPNYDSVGRITELYDVDEWFSWVEVCAVAAATGFALPVIVLLPILYSASLAEETHGMLLGFIIMLPAVWTPVMAGAACGSALAEAEVMLLAVPGEQQQYPPVEKHEIQVVTAGIFFWLSVPLGFFVPLYLGENHDEAGEASLVFFMLASNLVAFQWVVAPKLATTLHVYGRVGTHVCIPEAVVKLLYGASLLPMLVLLPLYLHGDVRQEARRMLAMFLLGLPPCYTLEAARVSHRNAMAKLPVLLALTYFGVVMPLGILLPAWLAGEPDSTGKSIFLAFMMTPLALCLMGATVFTALHERRLPFQPLDFFLLHESRRSDIVYASAVIILPVVMLLPIYFDGDLEETPALITLSYMAILAGTLIIMFGISYFSDATPQLKAPDVLNLPYATKQEVLRTSRLDTDPFSPGRKNVNSSNMAASALSLATLPPVGQTQRRGTGMSSASGAMGFGDNDERGGPSPIYPGSAKERKDSFDEAMFETDSTQRKQSRASVTSRKSAVWGGWEPGMACKAEYPSDGNVYDATIVALNWEKREATVAYIGSEGNEQEVPISRLYSADEMAGFDDPTLADGAPGESAGDATVKNEVDAPSSDLAC